MSEIVVSLGDPELTQSLGSVSGVRFIDWDLTGAAPEERIDIVVPPYWTSARNLVNLDGVSNSLVQGQSIGYDRIPKHLPAGFTFANAATVHETSTAELAMGLMLAAQRGIDRFARARSNVEWYANGTTEPSVADRSVLIIGYGGVGRALDARLTGFETQVTRVASSARDQAGPDGQTVHVHGIDELGDLLPQAEIVVLTVPHTEQTDKLMNQQTLALLPDGALLVNVARGKVVDTEALTEEVASGRLRAALDVTDPEPLPHEHPLWSCDSALISPHVGGDTTAMQPRVVALIRRQIAHLQNGETFENVVISPEQPRE
jgi:phosphoglycerate dehydrogenase-like enzyme